MAGGPPHDRQADGAPVSGAGEATGAAGGLRLDKWLWYARFFKTRTLASEMCAAGKIRVEGTVVTKAHLQVRPGQVLTFVQGRHVRVVKVLALGSRRGPASEAQTLYEDLAPPETGSALPRDPAERPASPGSPATRARGAGRPTKKERREIDRWTGEE
jgi:ribosome-associated heat shock protein Hsp15